MIASGKQSFQIERSINDQVYGTVNIISPISCIIDTPIFQRLHRIKQVSVCHLIYPTANHSRFEHSIGVYHLAFKFTERLMNLYPSIVTPSDVLCVSIAALIHDIGHGPFSHTFDNYFLKKVNPNCTWKHEDGTLMMWRYLLDENDGKVRKKLSVLLEPADFLFIEELIKPPKGLLVDGKWTLIGRSLDKSFLYCLVSNPFDSLDVDRMDYMLRDSKAAVIPISFSTLVVERFLDNIGICVDDQDGLLKLCYDKKIIDDYNQTVACRTRLHLILYRHKTVIAIEEQLVEILALANPYLKFFGKDGKVYNLADSIQDPVAYCKVTDDLMIYIQNSCCDELAPARKLLDDLEHRRLYRLIGYLQFKEGDQVNNAKSRIGEFFKERHPDVETFGVVSEMHQGLGFKKHPISKLLIFDKRDPSKQIVHLTESQIDIKAVPNFATLHVFLRSYEKPTPKLLRSFEEFVLEHYESNRPKKPELEQ